MSFRCKRASVLRLVERSGRVSRVVYVAKVIVVWLLNTMEKLVKEDMSSKIFKSPRDEHKAYLAQRCS
ncbi:hypothetical protein SLA2020_368370 [Shorea laevis]